MSLPTLTPAPVAPPTARSAPRPGGLLVPPRVGWVAPQPRKAMIVGVADMVASNDRSAQLVTYSLGSCVGVVIYDPIAKCGGLLHAMLADSAVNPVRAADRPAMFVNTGLPALFHAVYALGGQKSRMIAKLAGGAEMLDTKKVFNIGAKNVEMVKEMLNRNGVPLATAVTGGHDSRTLRLDLATGELTLDVPGHPPRLI